MDLKIYNAITKPTEIEKKEITNFLFENLGKYGDPREQINNAINYAVKESISFGGNVLVLKDGIKIVGAVVINETGMGGYIPENILVYIATHADYRGQGLGKRLMEETVKITKGDIALHVEKDNPAKFLYEKIGFTTPYLEMRLKKNNAQNKFSTESEKKLETAE